jgi:hypothetical protein
MFVGWYTFVTKAGSFHSVAFGDRSSARAQGQVSGACYDNTVS